jgi:Zn finger protein HypA/HybF involved in hydrogenase expression
VSEFMPIRFKTEVYKCGRCGSNCLATEQPFDCPLCEPDKHGALNRIARIAIDAQYERDCNS